MLRLGDYVARIGSPAGGLAATVSPSLAIAGREEHCDSLRLVGSPLMSSAKRSRGGLEMLCTGEVGANNLK
eukprot:159057-Hanusia_phi.AAC.1